ncbi:uncharacterized protein LOC122471199 isoform X2 [Prionailurus bengalensis]|uniref:uncharacterized protein LOC122471199 isoform X2 n=1 Tax=Prionailurus bengalensis TaxID=37029 RepID=UPI001CA9CB35|nr:uncharacterized protein LOC122471199 isoform X2 [Prionailurus bengalensis]
MSTAMNFGSKSFQPRPPDKGSFPLDHFGERRAAAGLLRRVSGRGSPPVAPCGPVGAGVRTRLQVGKLRPAAAHLHHPGGGPAGRGATGCGGRPEGERCRRPGDPRPASHKARRLSIWASRGPGKFASGASAKALRRSS